MNNEYFIDIALNEAYKAYKKGEIPIGAVIVKNNKIIAKAHNLIESKKDSTSHAEILAIKKASHKIKNWRLNDCILYTTLEPCEMCRGAIKNSRIDKTYYLSSKQDYKNSDAQFIKIDDVKSEEKNLKMLQRIFNRKTK